MFKMIVSWTVFKSKGNFAFPKGVEYHSFWENLLGETWNIFQARQL